MEKKQSANLLSPNFNEKISAHAFMREYYLRIGYHDFPKIKLIQYLLDIYLKYFRKIRLIIQILFNSKFIFKDPSKKKILIYDCENTRYLKIVLENLDYDILSTRINKIKKIFISKNILIYILRHFGKRSIKQNYIISIIKLINPKIVITHVDNNPDFHITSKYFYNKKIKFVAIQTANRGDTVYRSDKEISKIFIPEYLCFSKFDEDIHRSRNCDIKKYTNIGSLNTHLALNYVKLNKIKTNPMYDICLISEPMPAADGDYGHIENYQEKLGLVAKYTHRFAYENNLKLIFSAKGNERKQIEEEIFFYKNYLEDYEFKLSQQEPHGFSTYLNMMNSKVIIGVISTSLREAIILKKKVLSCNFTGNKDVIFPSNGICNFSKEINYEEFQNRLTQILNMDFEEYKNKLPKNVEYIMNTKIDPIKFIQNKVNSYIRLET